MRIQLMSDLHLEVHPHFRPEPAPGADLLVLAGDIGAYQARNQVQDADFGLSLFADWPVPVVYVPGNHEYDALDFDEAHQRLRASCAKFGFHWLEREVLVLLASGMTNKEIAHQLTITPNTVKRHLKSLFTKLDVNTRSAASAKAISMGVQE